MLKNYIYKTKDQDNIFIISDKNILKNTSFLKPIKEIKEQKKTFFILHDLTFIEKKDTDFNTICYIAENKNDLYNWFDQNGIYGFIDSNDLDYYNKMIDCMIDDKKRHHMFSHYQDVSAEKKWHPVPFSFSMRRFDECEIVIQILHNLFSIYTKKDIKTGIHELLLNAIEHGNLEISTDEKIDLYKTGHIFHALMEKLNAKNNLNKIVTISVDFSLYNEKPVIQITIEDSGRGFTLDKKSNDASPTTHLHGRGIMIAKTLGFDELIQNDAHNQITGLLYYKSL